MLSDLFRNIFKFIWSHIKSLKQFTCVFKQKIEPLIAKSSKTSLMNVSINLYNGQMIKIRLSFVTGYFTVGPLHHNGIYSDPRISFLNDVQISLNWPLKESESELILLVKYVYRYKEFDSGFTLLTVYLHRDRHTAKNMDNRN